MPRYSFPLTLDDDYYLDRLADNLSRIRAPRPSSKWASALLTALLIMGLSGAIPIRGAWIDHWFSQSLSRNLEHTVQVQNVRIWNPFSIGFDRLLVHSPDGPLLMQALSGDIKLRVLKPGFRWTYSMGMNLNGISFTRDFYKHSATGVGKLMHKPIWVDQLTFDILRRGSDLRLQISRCLSEEVSISGDLILKNLRVIHDNTAITISARALIKKII